MKFIIAIEPGDTDHAFGVVVPDLPGCFSAADTLDDAIVAAREGIEAWCEATIDDGGEIPPVGTLSEHQANPDYTGWIWAVADVPIERYFGPSEKLNITLPRRLLAKVDDYTTAHGETRSGFLARAALEAMQRTNAG